MRFFDNTDNGTDSPVRYGTEQEGVEAFQRLADKPHRYRIFYHAQTYRGLVFGSMDIGMDHPIRNPGDLAEVMTDVRRAHPDNTNAKLAGWSRYED